jgi:hypothetical protein
MLIKDSQVPDTSIRAQQLVLLAQYHNRKKQPHTAILYYVQAFKIFSSLFQQFPKSSISCMWRRESLTCIKHIRMICNFMYPKKS